MSVTAKCLNKNGFCLFSHIKYSKKFSTFNPLRHAAIQQHTNHIILASSVHPSSSALILTSTTRFTPIPSGLSAIPIHFRAYCSEYNEPAKPKPSSLPQLMKFPKIIWPSLVKSMKNWILINFIIRPYFDQEFNLSDFSTGTKHALQVISSSMATGDVNRLKGLISDEAINELSQSVTKMSVAQRSEVSVNKEDVYFTFPYQVGIMFDETNEKIQKRWVEITMVFHVLRGLKEMREKGETIPLNVGLMPEYRDKISICNYRFIKEFTQGASDTDWTVNVVNHFKPSDFIDDD